MRFFTSFAVAALAAIASADSKANPFKIPIEGYTFKVGEPTTLSWQPTTSGTVSLYLKWGAVTTAASGTAIATGITNDGSFTWEVPSSLAAQPDYTIEIVSDTDANDYNFIGRFTVEGSTVSVSSSSSSSTSASSTSTESSTSVSATQTTESSSSISASTTSTSTSTPTTLTTATTASSTPSSSSATKTSTTETSSTAISTSASASSSATPSETPNAVPTTNAGIATRVSGGMLALVAGAFML
ncbi:hypothetical protein N7457_004606 [Penicillium paradoxum]|uniref:uncharacterized protein n=1 Tax=Penicillium paradoxum TaxID=176176 RepID=UPI00254822AB|nr:uncharacterized protein N7457_004606 [Penicillium paradoxum]KAJ5782832.1 hypothetical protein N7457_004606 [Penicillium paradoxum]